MCSLNEKGRMNSISSRFWFDSNFVCQKLSSLVSIVKEVAYQGSIYSRANPEMNVVATRRGKFRCGQCEWSRTVYSAVRHVFFFLVTEKNIVFHLATTRTAPTAREMSLVYDEKRPCRSLGKKKRDVVLPSSTASPNCFRVQSHLVDFNHQLLPISSLSNERASSNKDWQLGMKQRDSIPTIQPKMMRQSIVRQRRVDWNRTSTWSPKPGGSKTRRLEGEPAMAAFRYTYFVVRRHFRCSDEWRNARAESRRGQIHQTGSMIE